MAFEIVEGLGAGAAAVERLARGRAEFGEALGLGRAAAWAEDRVGAEEGAARHRAGARRDAGCRDPAPALRAHPIGVPRPREPAGAAPVAHSARAPPRSRFDS